jgi:RimJ/RimL family protein N-acetyltransferase
MMKKSQYKYTFKKLTSKDITGNYISWLNNPIVNQFLVVGREKQTKETVSNYIDSFYGEEERYIWKICHDERMIGTTTLAFFNKEDNSVEAGLMIGDTDYWGKLASDSALKFVLDFAFNELKKDSVTGACCDENIGMVFTFKKLGFERGHVRRAPQAKVVHQWKLTKERWGG